jgi:hypothetical protein
MDGGNAGDRTQPVLPPKVAAILGELAKSDRVDAFAFHAIVRAANADGATTVHDVAVAYRDDYIRALRSEGRDAEREAGRLGMDEVCRYLLTSILPRLAEAGLLLPLRIAPEPTERAFR